MTFFAMRKQRIRQRAALIARASVTSRTAADGPGAEPGGFVDESQ
jgi:hypothetical protein